MGVQFILVTTAFPFCNFCILAKWKKRLFGLVIIENLEFLARTDAKPQTVIAHFKCDNATMTEKIKKIIFWTAIAFIGLTVFSLTIGQLLSYEFADYKVMHNFYDTIMQGLPVAILLTLFGTIKRENRKAKNWTFFGLTVLTSIISFVLMASLIFQLGFGAWTTVTTIYRHKTKNIEIKEQWFDVGALGYGGKRIVEIKPFLKYWILPTAIDTSKIDKENWILVNEEGKIKFP